MPDLRPAAGPPTLLGDAESHRRELLAHCYRMLGSLQEAEDLVQETYLRAWRSQESFEGRSSVRTWLYRIATNLCLTALQRPGRRVLPAGLGAPGEDPGTPLVAAPADVLWLDPFPGDPAELAETRWSLRLALIASLQFLPGRQRAVFVLREVLAFPAGDVAEMLGTSVAAVKSALQRARARLEEIAPDVDSLAEPDSPEVRDILDRYMTAFEKADVAALTELLRDDARLEVVPLRPWLAGKRACVPYLAREVLTAPGLYRMVPTVANGQPAAVTYRRDHPGAPFEPFGLAVLTTDTTHLVSITAFLDPGLVARFGFPGSPGAWS